MRTHATKRHTFNERDEESKQDQFLPQHDIDGGVVVVPVNVMMYLIKTGT
jgi:hypothetical protein